MKSIGENGGSNAVYAHFIERPVNLQGTAERAMGVNSLAVIQLEHNLGLALRLWQSASIIFRRQYSTGMSTSGSPPRSCIRKGDWGRAIIFTPATGSFAKEGGPYDEAICVVGMGGRI